MSRLMGGPALDPDAILGRITTAVGPRPSPRPTS